MLLGSITDRPVRAARRLFANSDHSRKLKTRTLRNTSELHQNRMLLGVSLHFLVVDRRGRWAGAEHAGETVRPILYDVDQQEGQDKHEERKQEN